MSKANPDVLQGTLDLPILKTLACGPQYSYGTVVRVQKGATSVAMVGPEPVGFMVRPERFELPTFWFVGKGNCPITLIY